jgi:Tfp pilus assembly protein PilZ
MLPWFGRRDDRTEHPPERRVSLEEPRWNLNHPLAVLKVVGERRTLLGYAENLSRKGMMIGSISPKAVGARYEVEFALPDPEDLVVRCTCRVAWARPYSKSSQTPGMGLEFLDLPDDLAARIESMLWRNGKPSRKAAMRIWSEFDHEWIRWRPQAALRKRTNGKEAAPREPNRPQASGLDPQVSLSCD